MTISKNQMRLLWTAKSKLGLSEDMFRLALVQIAGVTSTTELDKDGFEALLGFFEYLGFAPLDKRGPSYGNRPGMASFAQIELIRTLWWESTRGKAGEDELNKWLSNKFHLSSLRFVDLQTARKMIAALEAMKARERSGRAA